MNKAVHGGQFFQAVGADFSGLAHASQIINADVLDAWFDPSPQVIRKLSSYLPYICRTSPPTYSEGLVDTIARVRNLDTRNILTGSGSSSLMFLLLPSILEASERAVILDPMYGEYKHILENVIGSTVLLYALESRSEFKIDVDHFCEHLRDIAPRVAVIVNPNNPTGQFLTAADVVRILTQMPKESLLVVDETYIEYVGFDQSVERLVSEHSNLIVIKSMSKVYALSGLRVGYIVACKDIIDRISIYSPPWSVSFAAQLAAIEALRDPGYYAKKYSETHELRIAMLDELSLIRSVKAYASVANFLLIELLDTDLTSSKVVESLIPKEIFLRDADSLSKSFNGRFIRTAVKQAASNRRIVSALKEIL